jgi:hypothetical protein
MDAPDPFAEPFGKHPDKVAREKRNILAALPKGWDRNWKDVQAIEKI